MASVRYTSQHIVLEPESWRVQVSGEVLTPEPKVFELLAYLMRNPGRVVTKAELLDSLWGGEVVGESVLTRCVSCLRKLLVDDARDPTFIRTAHGREAYAGSREVLVGMADPVDLAACSPTIAVSR